MNFQFLKLLRILADRRITIPPLRAVHELRKRGINRMPEVFDNDKGGRLRSLKFLHKWLRGEMLTKHNGQWVLNSFLPPFPGEAYERMFENLLSGRRLSPVSTYIAVTGSCPFNCPHCSIKGRPKGELSTASWISAIEQLKALGNSVLGFTGGEPLMRDDLPELIETAVLNGMETIVFSSGAGLTPALAEKLKKAGLWAFCVSIESFDTECNAEMRNSSEALPIAIEALKLAKATGFYTMIGSVGRRGFVKSGEYEKIYEFARKLGVDEFRIVEPMPCGKMIGSTEDNLLTQEHVKKLRDFHVTTNHRGKKPKVCAFNHVESPEYFGCGGGTQHMFIDYNGQVCPCDFTPLSFGCIENKPLSEIWQRMNNAMHNPRRNCFIRKNYQIIQEHYKRTGDLPLPPVISEKVCSEAGTEDFSDYFTMVTGRKR